MANDSAELRVSVSKIREMLEEATSLRQGLSDATSKKDVTRSNIIEYLSEVETLLQAAIYEIEPPENDE